MPESERRYEDLEDSFSHPKCYANQLGFCSEKITGEHWVSKNILFKWKNIHVKGLPHLGDSFFPVSHKNLIANILCKSHNEELSHLDTEAGKLYEYLSEITTPTLGLQKNKQFNLNGNFIELWALKVLCGMVASKNASKIYEFHETRIPEKWVNILFGREQFDKNEGLFFRVNIDKATKDARDVYLDILFADERSRIVGIKIEMRGIEMFLMVEKIEDNPNYQYHSEKFSFIKGKFKEKIKFHYS